jgi:hypothetical protein
LGSFRYFPSNSAAGFTSRTASIEHFALAAGLFSASLGPKTNEPPNRQNWFGWSNGPIHQALEDQRAERLRRLACGPGLKLVELGCGGTPAVFLAKECATYPSSGNLRRIQIILAGSPDRGEEGIATVIGEGGT